MVIGYGGNGKAASVLLEFISNLLFKQRKDNPAGEDVNSVTSP